MLKLFKYGELSGGSDSHAQEPKKSSISLKSSATNTLLQEISSLYLKEIKGNYEQIMKNVNSIIISRKALFSYSRNEGVDLEKNLNFFGKCSENPCFGCNVNFLSNLLRFFSRNNNGIAEINEELVFHAENGLIESLRRNMADESVFTDLRNKSRKAIVQLLGNNEKSERFFEAIAEKLRNSEYNYVVLIIEIIRNFKEKIFMNQVSECTKKKQGVSCDLTTQEHLISICKKGIHKILNYLPKVLESSKKDANIANKCLLPILVFIQKELSYSDLKEIIKKLMRNRENEGKEPKNPNAMEEEPKNNKEKKKEKLKVFQFPL